METFSLNPVQKLGQVRPRVHFSQKASQNRRDLPDDFGINPVPEMLRAERPAGIGADKEIALQQSAPTAEVTSVPFENEVDRIFAKRIRPVLYGLLDSPVDDNDCGIYEQRMAGSLISAHPEYVRKREVAEAAKFLE